MYFVISLVVYEQETLVIFCSFGWLYFFLVMDLPILPNISNIPISEVPSLSYISLVVSIFVNV